MQITVEWLRLSLEVPEYINQETTNNGMDGCSVLFGNHNTHFCQRTHDEMFIEVAKHG